jgi:AraC-like DNA-binding protein
MSATMNSCTHLLAHRARMREPRPGLRVHVDDATDQFDGVAQGRCEPGLHLVILLEGQLDLRYGEQDIRLATPRLPTHPPDARGAVLLHLAQAEPFARTSHSGRYARRVSLGLSADWLAQLQQASQAGCPAPLAQLLEQHLRPTSWLPSARALALAEQIVRPPALSPWLQAIYVESRVLELLGEALGPWQGELPAEPGNTLSPGTLRRLREVRAFLQTTEADELSLDEIARRIGMNVNSLQAQFRQAFGSTVIAFLRDSRLQRARLALEHEGLCIKQAAALAGYTSAANFSTAFTRCFGLTPKAAQRSGQSG